jgi:hypothetical protein
VIPLGEIVRLQIQRSSLKLASDAGAAHPQRYEPAPLLEVPALVLTPGGAIGLFETGAQVLDVHHTDHPASKNSQRMNDLSIGFTAHYAAMRTRFGNQLRNGIAGENLLVQSERDVELDELTAGVVIAASDGTLVKLERIGVAEPCVPFTRFAMRLGPTDPSSPQVTEALQFLRAGRRGFYASYTGPGVTVRPGDRVFALAPAASPRL